MKKTAIAAALLCLLWQGGAAAADEAYTCAENSDCRLVTSYVAPEGERPGKTLVRCAHKDRPLKEGDTLTAYNDHLTARCQCLPEKSACGLKDD